jgi:hypothetical protein
MSGQGIRKEISGFDSIMDIFVYFYAFGIFEIMNCQGTRIYNLRLLKKTCGVQLQCNIYLSIILLKQQTINGGDLST